MTKNLYGIHLKQLSQEVKSTYYSKKIFDYLYRKKIEKKEKMLSVKQSLLTNYNCALPRVVAEIHSNDKHTQKFVLELSDQSQIETVLMRFEERYTVCVSTQVGCAVGCVFCATGHMGFQRNLATEEIVGQVILMNKIAPVQNIVFMGMGEPLNNYDCTIKAIQILTDDKGLSIANRRITLSTVGIVPKIRKLIEEDISVNLAVSLHGATDIQRNSMVPIGKKWPLSELLKACREYSSAKKKRIFFEWTVIAGKNDGSEEAHLLGKNLKGISSHINLIPLNPIEDYQGKPGNEEQIQLFRKILKEYNIPSTIRQRRGIDIAAGCGQLIKISRDAVKNCNL